MHFWPVKHTNPPQVHAAVAATVGSQGVGTSLHAPASHIFVLPCSNLQGELPQVQSAPIGWFASEVVPNAAHLLVDDDEAAWLAASAAVWSNGVGLPRAP